MEIMTLNSKTLTYLPDTHSIQLTISGPTGLTYRLKPGYLVLRDGERLDFSTAVSVEIKAWERGRGKGLDVSYRGFPGLPDSFGLTTRVWLPEAGDQVYCEWIPHEPETKVSAARVVWPVAELFQDGYTVLPLQQGVLIPCDWPTAVEHLPFDGQFCTSSAYMPWFGQVSENGAAWQLIAETPWDGGYHIEHPAGGPTRELSFYWLPSLGAWRYKRVCRLYLSAGGADYNSLAKTYRGYVKEMGHFTSLREKAERNAAVKRLIGASVVHLGIKSHTDPASSFYDTEHPERNDSLVTFAERTEQMKRLTRLGAGRFYLHVDGWGNPGYDNKHPDIFPVCEAAGGAAGLLNLTEAVQGSGNLIGLHDQYRDYYVNAETFDWEEAVQDEDGSHPEHARWAGGRQTYLCGRLAPLYVKRNFARLFELGFHPDCSYLDVFTCNEPDECFHPEHRMSRRECLESRLSCFAWLNDQGIAPSSEECTDWAMRELVFCHYGPHEFMLKKPGSPRAGLPVPLFNLVYHDAMMLPWPMDKASEEKEDDMLFALLNAGMPYLIRDGAYPGIDGAFADESREDELLEQIERARTVQTLQEKLAYCEMIRHRFITQDIQETLFDDGTRVRVDFAKGSYEIIMPSESSI